MTMGQQPPRPGPAAVLLAGLAAAGTAAVFLVGPSIGRVYDRATRRSTMADMRVWDRALAAYISDHGAAPPSPNGEVTFKKPLVSLLMPYLDRVRTADWWGFRYLVWTGEGGEESGLPRTSPRDYIIISRGKGGQREAWRFDPAAPEAGLFDAGTEDGCEYDLILWNGREVRWPKKGR